VNTYISVYVGVSVCIPHLYSEIFRQQKKKYQKLSQSSDGESQNVTDRSAFKLVSRVLQLKYEDSVSQCRTTSQTPSCSHLMQSHDLYLMRCFFHLEIRVVRKTRLLSRQRKLVRDIINRIEDGLFP